MAFRVGPPSSSPSSSQNTSATAASSSSRSFHPPMVRAPDDTDSSGSHSARGTPTQNTVDLPRMQTTSRGGCWTCRLRRKKCDEQRIGESQTCRTCQRLNIECLGWGTKRPEWMRDKQMVEKHKARIKAQLIGAGMIRGQPRSSLAHRTPHPSRAARPYPHRATQPARRNSTPSQNELPTFHISDNNSLNDDPLTMNTPMHSPTFQLSMYNEPNIGLIDIPELSPYAYPSDNTSPPSNTSSDVHFDTFPFEFEPFPQTPSPLPGQNSIQGEHVLYYFAHVTKFQYVFGGSSVNNILHVMIVQEPQGAVTNAVCALANLHYTRTRLSQGVPIADPEQTARGFYDDAFRQLMEKKRLHRQYSESDAIAALQLINYSLFAGGGLDWQQPLAIACEWLAQTGITNVENPKGALLSMSLAARFAVKATMWIEIFASITLHHVPGYLAFYRLFLAESTNLWPRDDNPDLRMESLFGCPNEALLALAEVSALAHWKTQEMHTECLSVRMLAHRGNRIEERLRQHSSTQAGMTEFGLVPPRPPRLLGIPMTQMPISSNTGDLSLHVESFPDDDARQTVADIFREAAVLYLHTVLSDPYPGVPEIRASVSTIVNLLNQLPVSEVDRSLAFPICLAGCLTDDPMQREVCKRRMQTVDGVLGSPPHIVALMESVWQRRAMQGGAVCWREVMRERGMSILLL